MGFRLHTQFLLPRPHHDTNGAGCMETKNAEYKFEQTDLNGKVTSGSFCDKFLADPFAAKLLNTTFAPEQPRITKDDKLNFWNDTWARLNYDRGSKNGSKAVELFVVLVAFLCGGRDDIRDHLLTGLVTVSSNLRNGSGTRLCS